MAWRLAIFVAMALSVSLAAESKPSRAEQDDVGRGGDTSIANLPAEAQHGPAPSPSLEGGGEANGAITADAESDSPMPAASPEPTPRHGPAPSPSSKALAKAPAAESNGVPAHFRYQEHANKMCSGVSYTNDKSVGCNGWGGLSQAQCQQKCSQSEQAPHCPRKQCLAAVFFSASGWCHLYEPSECQTQSSMDLTSTYKKVKQGIFDNPVVDEIKHTMHKPLAHGILGAGGLAVGLGVAAAGVEAALRTRAQPGLPPPRAPRLAVAPPRPATTRAPADAVLAGGQHASGAPAGVSVSSGAPALNSRGAPPSVPSMPTLTTTSVGAAGGLSAPYGISSLLPWLPLLILCCCCLAMGLFTLACRGKKKSRASTYSHDEEDTDYESEDYDIEDGLE